MTFFNTNFNSFRFVKRTFLFLILAQTIIYIVDLKHRSSLVIAFFFLWTVKGLSHEHIVWVSMRLFIKTDFDCFLHWKSRLCVAIHKRDFFWKQFRQSKIQFALFARRLIISLNVDYATAAVILIRKFWSGAASKAAPVISSVSAKMRAWTYSTGAH